MACSCSETANKIVVSVFSIIVLFFGAVWLFFGVFLVVMASQAESAIPTGSFVFIIVAGIVVVAIAILGFIGAWKRNRCMLLTFATFAGFLFVIELIAAVIVFVTQTQFVRLLGFALQQQISAIEDSSQGPGADDFMQALDKLQETLKCCGGVSASDWKTVPASCCPSGNKGCKDPYPVGCAEAAFDLFKGYFLASGIITILLCIVELTAVICACVLAHQYKNYEKV
uniref:Tetraspanin n=1 Tax=Mesocestoides corti TaxID=53468 RepID=A0A5K3FH28_MESCO